MKHNNPQNEIAFVLGNGISRKHLKHSAVIQHGTVYGCNALYREFEPDFLIAVDVKMVNEIIASGYQKTHVVWTNPNKGIKGQGINFFNPHKGWSSGPTALHFACERGHREIYIFGFDYQGIAGKFNNIYADTYNYKFSTDVATFHGNWLSQTEKTIRDWNSVKFYRVIAKGDLIPENLGVSCPNLQHIYYEDFERKFPGTIYSDQNDQKSII